MKNTLALVLMVFGIVGCSMPQEEKENIAAVTCSIMSETRNMDAAIRVEKMNDARDKIGGEPFLRGDAVIKEAFEWGLCQELVLNETYDERLQSLKDAKREIERIAAEIRAEQNRIAAEKRAEEQKIAAERRAEENRIAAEKRAEEQKIAAEKQRISDTKPTVREEFHSNGMLKSRINYQPKSDGGKRHGLSEGYNRNGRLEWKKTFIDGKIHGLSEKYNRYGLLVEEINFKQGKLDGLFKSFDGEGRLYDIKCFNNNKKVDISYCGK
ncbi:hypothetical protein N9507_05740 [Gammaproteobacteria bacterium]|nr:hypothetical protein [Gammaproteobacteria bacterium]